MKASGGIREEIEELRSSLNMDDPSSTPLDGETLRDFYSRTTEKWSQEVIQHWRDREASSSGSYEMEVLTEKAIKRQGFQLAEMSYNQLSPVLSRLHELEEQQKNLEEHYDHRSSASKPSSTKRR